MIPPFFLGDPIPKRIGTIIHNLEEISINTDNLNVIKKYEDTDYSILGFSDGDEIEVAHTEEDIQNAIDNGKDRDYLIIIFDNEKWEEFKSDRDYFNE